MSALSSSKPDFTDLAKAIARAHFNTTSVSCRLHDEQGSFSRTYVVELKDQSHVIVQFRDTPLDLSHYVLARRTFYFILFYFFRQNMDSSPEHVCREIGNPGSNYREDEHRYHCFRSCVHHELHPRIDVDFSSGILGGGRSDRWPTLRGVISLYRWPRLLRGCRILHHPASPNRVTGKHSISQN